MLPGLSRFVKIAGSESGFWWSDIPLLAYLGAEPIQLGIDCCHPGAHGTDHFMAGDSAIEDSCRHVGGVEVTGVASPHLEDTLGDDGDGE